MVRLKSVSLSSCFFKSLRSLEEKRCPHAPHSGGLKNPRLL